MEMNQPTNLINWHFEEEFYRHMTEGLEEPYDHTQDTIQSIANEYREFVDLKFGILPDNMNRFLFDIVGEYMIQVNWHLLATNFIEVEKRNREEVEK